MAVKVTYSLDEETVRKIAVTAERLRKPKSQIVRDAVRLYRPAEDKLSESERRRLLKILDEYVAQPPSRPAGSIDRELRELRAVRRLPGRLHPVD
ncbi:MAG: ribbon-helix-helix protein, CopG family [Terriglobales bacterium]